MNEKNRIFPRILVLMQRDSYIREFHLNTEISTKNLSRYALPCKIPTENIGDVGKALIRGLGCIRGIEVIILYKYHLRIEIGRAFYWYQIQPEVLDLLKACFDEDFQMIDILEENNSNLRYIQRSKNETSQTTALLDKLDKH